MVGPSRQQRIGKTARRNLRYGFVAVVALSTGLMGLLSGASPVQTGLLFLVGAVVGTGLLWYLSWTVRNGT